MLQKYSIFQYTKNHFATINKRNLSNQLYFYKLKIIKQLPNDFLITFFLYILYLFNL